MEKLFEVIRKLVLGKKSEMEDARRVYTGSFREDGRWERDSLALMYPEVTVVDVNGPIKPVLDRKEFIGGNSNRAVYLALEEFLAKYPRLGKWWESEGDSHLLASMFLRPGKLAVRRGEVVLPARTDEEVNDGVLATLDRKAWQGFVSMYGLPQDASWAQVTVFAPEYGVVTKGSIRRALPGELPATYVGSWKSLPQDVAVLQHTHIGVLETDSTYRPQASINLQEYTYWVKGRNTRLAPWVLQAIAREQQRILSEEKVSPATTWGYLQKLGLPAPDELMAEVIKGQQGALYDLLGRWPLPREEGWRGKVSGSVLVTETEAVREILLPKGCARVGDVVYVSRNPALAVNGWVRYTVVGHVEGNVAYVSGLPGTAFNAVLGGDFDGDDLVVLFQCPVEEYHEPAEVDLQSWKATGRAFGSQTVEERLARWQKEVNSNIGRWDVLARYAIDLGVADSQVKEELAKLVQFTISLKKRVGELEVPESIKRLAAEVAPVKEFTPTYLFRKYPEMDRAEREMLEQVIGNQLGQLGDVLKLVEDGLEAIQQARPRWTLKAAIEVARRTQVKPELEEKAGEFFQQYADLAKARFEAAQANDGDLKSQLGREARYLTQVAMPEYMLGLEEPDAVAFSAALVRVNQAAEWWLFAAHPKFLTEVLKETFATEKAMLVGEHNLKEGDEVVIPAGVREVEVGGKVLKLSNGIVLFEGEARAKVVKVYPKSVVLDFGTTKTVTKTKVGVSLLDF